jgi:hypothetical protein
MLVKFLQRATVADRLFVRGDVHDFDDEVAKKLIADGIAEANTTLAGAAPDQTPEPATTKKQGKKK